MQNPKYTCLYDEHVKLGARMEEFAGYQMPIVYTSIKEEHQAVRENVGMFDVSHMGEFLVKGADATAFIDYVFANDILDKQGGSVTYGMFLYTNGTYVDDLLVYKVNDLEYFLVVNASNIAKDYNWLVDQTEGFDVTITNLSEDYSEIAVQGPEAEKKLLEVLNINLAYLEFFHFHNYEYEGWELLISRTGYTGEDGFEIYASAEAIQSLWQVLITNKVVPCGLGARDTLRFEASLPLYGHEISAEITPLEAGLKFFTKIDSDSDFIGKKALLAQQEQGLTRRLVGIELNKLSIPRSGYKIYVDEVEVGYVTTGYLSPTLNIPIALAMIDKAYSKKNTEVDVQIRNKLISGFVRDKKFLKKNYKKGA